MLTNGYIKRERGLIEAAYVQGQDFSASPLLTALIHAVSTSSIWWFSASFDKLTVQYLSSNWLVYIAEHLTDEEHEIFIGRR